jgi:glycosyltransferase involved in cell wall biosynthesis
VGTGERRRFVFVLEQTMGHAAHAANVARVATADPRIDATIVPLGPPGGRPIDSIPLVRNWSARASWGARAAVRAGERRHGRPDALYIHTQVAALLAGGIMRRIPTVVSMDATPANFDSLAAGYQHHRSGDRAERVKRAVNRRAFTGARTLVAWSQWAADSLVDDYGVDRARVRVISPGVDLGRFRPPGPPGASSASSATADPPGPLRVLFVGADFDRKGGADLVSAVRQLAPGTVELDIVTTGAIALEDASGPRVRVHTGLRPGTDGLVDLYRRAGIFAMPSASECFGIAFLEAMACGVPVVGCPVGAGPELIDDGHNGLLVPPHHPTALAGALHRLAASPDLRTRMGRAGRRAAERGHDADRNTAAILDLLGHMAGEGDPVL